MRIESIERLNRLFARADVEVEDRWFKNVMLAKRKGHYAVVILKGQESREIPVPDNLTEQLRPYFIEGPPKRGLEGD